jgi:cytidylate kinase
VSDRTEPDASGHSALVIAIDGAAGSGKSTLARGVAEALGLPYLNTGSMYRALTLEALRRGVDPGDGAGLAHLMQGLTFSLDRAPGSRLRIGGNVPEPELEGSAVDATVSQVSSHPEVRALMHERQRALGRVGAVVEGRDIGSVVFPDAAVKIFLVADPGARAARRVPERTEDARATEAALHARDAADASLNPFEPVPGAIVIDTGRTDAPEALRVALAAIEERTGGHR